MTERNSMWLLIVLPVVVAVLLLVPVMCGGGSGSCAQGMVCEPIAERCYSLVGVPAHGVVAAFGVATAGAAGTAYYLRWIRRSRA